MTRLLLFSLVLALASCGTPKVTAPSPTVTAPAPTAAASYAGEWTVTVSGTPAGNVTGQMMLAETADGLSGSFSAGGTSTDLRSVTRTDDGLTITFYSSEYQTDVDLKLTGAPDADTLTGKALGTYGVTATRKM